MEKWVMKDPEYGDHIRVKIGNIYHHAIYIGNDEVIQFGLPFDYTKPAKDVFVIQSPIVDFLAGGFLEVKVFNHHEKKQKKTPEESVATAKSLIGTGGYDILKNNCEHFVNYCIFGIKISKQVEKIQEEVKNKLGK